MKPTSIRVQRVNLRPGRDRDTRCLISNKLTQNSVSQTRDAAQTKWWQAVLRSTTLRVSLCLCVFSALVLVYPTINRLSATQPQAQTQVPIRVQFTVPPASANLPITIGVPLSEAMALTDVNQLGVVNSSNAVVPAQISVKARWRGLPTDTTKLIKWVLVDFKAVAAGNYFLTRAAQGVPAGSKLTRLETTTLIKLKGTQLEIDFGKTGSDLVHNLKIANVEQLKAPLSITADVPRAAMITKIDGNASQLTVTETSSLRAGDAVRFVFNDTLKWSAGIGTTRIVTNSAEYITGHRYVIDDGTPKREEFVVASIAGPQDERATTSLRFSHDVGAKIRDLTIEQESATLRKVSGQLIEFTAPLRFAHAKSEKVCAVVANQTTIVPQNLLAKLTVDAAKIEEFNELRAVVVQEGALVAEAQPLLPLLRFKVRYHVYADQPFVRVRLQVSNNGTYGFGAYNLNKGPYPQHALLRSLSAVVPTVGTASGAVEVLNSATAHQLFSAGQTAATVKAGSGDNLLELSVPEFTENFPKALNGNAAGIKFDLLPNTSADYVFDGARAKTTDFYLGREVVRGRALTNALLAQLEPSYIATTGAVRAALVEKRSWSATFAQDAELAEAATRYERMMASGYDFASCNAPNPQSIFEYRQSTEFGEHLGWRNFGDLGWGDGYSNLHYDLPFLMLREYLRTGDKRAFQLGSELTRYRADWGHYQGNDYWDVASTYNFKGMAFYEKGDHGSFLEPKPSHIWIEGMWLYWAMTGDEGVHESAIEGSDALKRLVLTFDNALSWNEPRWAGWPLLGLVAAWRYSGELSYLARARDDCYLIVSAEEAAGRKGYFIATGVDWANKSVQPWAWTGYVQQGVIEFWRETQDKRTADFLVRVADWFVGNATPTNRPLVGGTVQADGTYLPYRVAYFWEPGKVTIGGDVLSAGMGLPVLVAAARITNRTDLWTVSRKLFKDTAFYRDSIYGGMSAGARATISFRSAFYTGSSTKAYGQTGLTINDFLPEMLGTVVLPRGTVVIPPSTNPPPAPTATPGDTSGGGTGATTGTGGTTTKPPFITAPKTDGMINVAYNRPASSLSSRPTADITGEANTANDGLLRAGTRISGWQSQFDTGKQEWWQVDLGKAERVMAIEIVFRQDLDQITARRYFNVLGSNDPTFATSSVLTGKDETAVTFGKPFLAGIADASKYRYLRIQKSKADDADSAGRQVMSFTEVRVFAYPTPPPTVALPNMATLVNVALKKAAIASTSRSWPDVTGDPASANDGLLTANGKTSAWHSESNSGQLEWWQVDLGSPQHIRAVEITFRTDVDQATCRRNFVVLGANSPDFVNPTVLAMPTDNSIPFQQNWKVGVGDAGSYRFIRISKTLWDERDASAQQFFNLVEARLYADAAPRQISMNEITAQQIAVGETLTFLVKKLDAQNRPLTITTGPLPENASFDTATCRFTFTPHSGQAGKLFPIQFSGAVSGGATQTVRMDTSVTLTGAPKLVLTGPTTSAILQPGQPVQVSWATEPGTRVVRYRVLLSADRGLTYGFSLGDVSGSIGQFRWTIPANYPANQPLRFLVMAFDSQNRVGFDYSRQDLVVRPPTS